MKKKFPFQSVISPLTGFIVCILIILFCAQNPLSALASLFTGTFTSPYYFGSMLNTAAFLMLAGTGASLSLKAGNMNLGGEGQIYTGGFVAALVLTSSWKIPSWLLFTLAFLLCLASGAGMALLSAVLKKIKGAEVLLTSYLISAASIPIVDGLITSSRTQAEQNLLALPYIDSVFRFPQLLAPSPFTISFFFAIAVCLAAWFFLTFTYSGRKLTLWGTSPEFARYCGFKSDPILLSSLTLSGALHALTGFAAVCGTFYTCHLGFASGMGWNALSASLIVSSNPLALIPASLVLAWLYTSADRVALTQGFAFDIGGIVQGCVLFAIAIPFSIEKIKLARLEKKQDASQEARS